MAIKRLLALGLILGSSVAHAAPLTVTTILEPGAVSSAFWDVNNAGTVAGYSVIGGVSRAFTWSAGTFTALTGPDGAVGSSASGISDSGVVVGNWVAGPGLSSGFIYSGGTYTTYDAPGATETHLRAISPDGRYLTGYYVDDTALLGQGFVLDTTSSVLTLIGAGGNDFTIAQGVSNAGVVVGSDLIRDDTTGATTSRPGFIFDLGANTRTDYDLPGYVRTAFRAIDSSGVVSGWVTDVVGPLSVSSGFTGGPATPEYLFVPGGDNTFVEGNNDLGWLVGTVFLPDGTTRALLATPVPEPATAMLVLIAGAMGLALRRRRTGA